MNHLLAKIKECFEQKTYKVSRHAQSRMGEHHITETQIIEAMLSNDAEIIEVYPEDPRGPSYLVYRITKAGIILHVVVSEPPSLAVITVYYPSLMEWMEGWQN